MFLPTSISAMSMDEDFKSRTGIQPLLSTSLEMESGFSRTCSWFSAEPMEDTCLSAYTGRMVSSPAPPTSWWMLARTVTRAFISTGYRFGYGGYGWRVDYLRLTGSLHGLEHVAAH